MFSYYYPGRNAPTQLECERIDNGQKLLLTCCFRYYMLFPSSPSAQSLNTPDRDPSGLAVGHDGLAVITTNLDVIVARDGTKVSSLSVDYEPVCVAFHPSEPEVAVGGKVGEIEYCN